MKNYDKIMELKNKLIALLQIETELIEKGLYSQKIKEVFSKREAEMEEEYKRLEAEDDNKR